MAAWQFKLSLVPQAWCLKNSSNTEALYEGEGYDTTVAWVGFQPEECVEKIVDKYFSRSDAWSDDFVYWGETKKTDVHLWFEDGDVFDLAIRIDLTEPCGSVIRTVDDLARELQCYLFVPEQKVIFPPSVTVLEKAIMESNAALFVTGSGKYFENYKKT